MSSSGGGLVVVLVVLSGRPKINKVVLSVCVQLLVESHYISFWQLRFCMISYPVGCGWLSSVNYMFCCV